MGTTRVFHIAMVIVGIAVLLTVWPAPRSSAQPGAVQIDIDDIGPKLPWPLTSNCLLHKAIESFSSFRRRHVGLYFVLALEFYTL